MMKKINQDTAIVIPVFNEAMVIGAVIEAVAKDFHHIICVDDGSSDVSAGEILKTSAYLVRHPINMGQGAALQTGIEFARSLPDVSRFVTYDADGQHRLADVHSMLATLDQKNVDIVLGSRFLGETKNMPFSKLVILKAAIVFSNATSGIKLTDTHNGLRVFTKKVADKMQITQPDMSHASEILEFIAREKFSFVEVPVTIEYTDYSKAKGQSGMNAINIAFDTILRRFK